MITPEERAQLKSEIMEELKAERKGKTLWREYRSEHLKSRLESLVSSTEDAYKLQSALNQFVHIATGTRTDSIREHQMKQAKAVAGIFIKAFEEAKKVIR